MGKSVNRKILKPLSDPLYHPGDPKLGIPSIHAKQKKRDNYKMRRTRELQIQKECDWFESFWLEHPELTVQQAFSAYAKQCETVDQLLE